MPWLTDVSHMNFGIIPRAWLGRGAFLLLLWNCSGSPSGGETNQIPWDMRRLAKAPEWMTLENPKSEAVKAISFAGLPFRGKPTRVFAWVGIPILAPNERAPAMVLIHGGGGTAFAEWVRLWVGRGYAAIAMDTCGQIPEGTYGHWLRAEQGGPPGWGGLDQIKWAQQDQWTYHAVADAILAHSLIRSFPEVDSNRTGVTGISWGGYLTCIVAPVDGRFKLAVPVYGCGYYRQTIFGDELQKLPPADAERWLKWWDPAEYLAEADLPMLWVNGSNDFAYTLPAYQQSYRRAKGPRTLCIRLRMVHGHGGPGENPEEIRVFCDSILKNGKSLAKIKGSGIEKGNAWATYSGPVAITNAQLNFTRDAGRWQDRTWETINVQVTGDRVAAPVPPGAKAIYFNLFDERNCVVSSEHELMESTAR